MRQCSSKRLYMRQRSGTMWCRQTAWFRSTPTTSTTIQSPSLIQQPSRPSDGSTLTAHSDVSFDQQKIPSKFQAILCRLLFPLGGVDGTALGNHLLGGKKSYSGKFWKILCNIQDGAGSSSRHSCPAVCPLCAARAQAAEWELKWGRYPCPARAVQSCLAQKDRSLVVFLSCTTYACGDNNV